MWEVLITLYYSCYTLYIHSYITYFLSITLESNSLGYEVENSYHLSIRRKLSIISNWNYNIVKKFRCSNFTTCHCALLECLLSIVTIKSCIVEYWSFHLSFIWSTLHIYMYIIHMYSYRENTMITLRFERKRRRFFWVVKTRDINRMVNLVINIVRFTATIELTTLN